MGNEYPPAAPAPAKDANPAPKKRNRAVLIIAIIAALLVAAGGTVVALTQSNARQHKDTLLQVKDQRLNALAEARDKLQPAANAYLAAYKKARNSPASKEQALQDSNKELEDFRRAAEAARSSLESLKSGIDAGDAVNTAVQQLADSHQGYFDYMEGLVDSYPRFEGLFREDDSAGCNGLFVGSKAGNLRERQQLLAKAAAPCRGAAGELKESGNTAYKEFARTFENRVADLEKHAEVTAKSEESYNEFVRLKDEFEKKADDAEARNAPSEEVLKIADDARALNSTIRSNRAEFDFAADRYLDGVRDMPDLVDEVFTKHVKEDVKHYEAVIPLRVQILTDVIDAELVE
jgi:chromosome segregation ATPase